MEPMIFSYTKSCLLSKDELASIGEKLQSEIEHIADVIENGGYETLYASVNLPIDQELHKKIMQIVAEKKKLNPSMLLVIGIGGSNLGALAVHRALFGMLYNEDTPEIKIYFVDTVDTDYIYDIILLVEQELEKGKEIILNVISKSGTTTETIANFELFLHLLHRAKKDAYHENIVVTTDEGSKLWDFAQKENFTCLSVPKKVGGRFSVFSAVGLFPLALLGVDIQLLCEGAESMVPACVEPDIFGNPAALSAALLATYYHQGIHIHDTFLFSVDLYDLGNWYRQLLAESIGKELDQDGNKVNVGITPTVSVGSADLHSVGQLYLGGPYDKFTTFVSVQKNKSNVVLPQYDTFEKLVAKIQGKPVSFIMDAIFQGVQTAYYKNKRPFISILLPEKSAYYIGQFMQFKMFEIMYLGFLLHVNPFDQPQVQLYKKETRNLLKKQTLTSDNS